MNALNNKTFLLNYFIIYCEYNKDVICFDIDSKYWAKRFLKWLLKEKFYQTFCSHIHTNSRYANLFIKIFLHREDQWKEK